MMHITFSLISPKFQNFSPISTKCINLPIFIKFTFFLQFTLFASLPNLTMMHLCIMLYTYWTPLYVEAGLVDCFIFPFTGLEDMVSRLKDMIIITIHSVNLLCLMTKGQSM